jgi:hypothetical protein
MTARFTVSRFFRLHLAAILALGLLNLFVLAGDARGSHLLFGYSPLFRLSAEGNIPNLFSALGLAAAALAAARLTQAGALREGERRGWIVLAAVLALMALDEAAQVHEAMNAIGRRFRASGPFYYIGAFPYLLVAAALALLLFRFWLEQSSRVKRGIAIGGLCYLSAAIGMEVMENILIDRGTSTFDARMAALFAVEELGEMFAAALLLRTFLVRFEELGGGPLLTLAGERPLFAIEIVPRDAPAG